MSAGAKPLPARHPHRGRSCWRRLACLLLCIRRRHRQRPCPGTRSRVNWLFFSSTILDCGGDIRRRTAASRPRAGRAASSAFPRGSWRSCRSPFLGSGCCLVFVGKNHAYSLVVDPPAVGGRTRSKSTSGTVSSAFARSWLVFGVLDGAPAVVRVDVPVRLDVGVSPEAGAWMGRGASGRGARRASARSAASCTARTFAAGASGGVHPVDRVRLRMGGPGPGTSPCRSIRTSIARCTGGRSSWVAGFVGAHGALGPGYCFLQGRTWALTT